MAPSSTGSVAGSVGVSVAGIVTVGVVVERRSVGTAGVADAGDKLVVAVLTVAGASPSMGVCPPHATSKPPTNSKSPTKTNRRLCRIDFFTM
jgi:hypothetical protein